MATPLNYVLLGAIAMSTMVAGLFFLKFWQAGRDRLFLLFALSFFVEAANRTTLALSDHPSEGNPWCYCVRLFSYVLIIVAILDKNRDSSSNP